MITKINKTCEHCLCNKPKVEFGQKKNNVFKSICLSCEDEREKIKLLNNELIKSRLSKICVKCKIEKPLMDFNNNIRAYDGKNCYCKPCAKLLNNSYPVNKILKSLRKQKYRFKNRERINDRQNELSQARKLRRLAGRANSTARKVSTGEEITPWQIFHLAHKQKLVCAISGIKLTNENISLDHIVSYSAGGKNVIENIQLIDYDINRMKNSHDQSHFLEIIKRIYHFLFTEKPSQDNF